MNKTVQWKAITEISIVFIALYYVNERRNNIIYTSLLKLVTPASHVLLHSIKNASITDLGILIMFLQTPFIRSIDDPIFHYQLTKDDLEKNTVTYFSMGMEQNRAQIPWSEVSPERKERLTTPYILNERLTKQCFDIKIHSDCAHELSLSIIALATLGDIVHDLSSEISVIGKKAPINFADFTSAFGHENLFFVLHYSPQEKRYMCIEVHPSENIVYRKVILHESQLMLAKWQGEYISKAEIQEAFIEGQLQAAEDRKEYDANKDDNYDRLLAETIEEINKLAQETPDV